ncbi:hypothetical protein NDU88_009331 [Pleurodeles waltl]|uniref:Uncharacterized protein n=1 Tax=Pleurodeles waltl TaxID=8319 RepID=A0AAV7QTB6_PLEWA|nr:hypothetical protein NDU88_009331 [Pleurodeles waltl]
MQPDRYCRIVPTVPLSKPPAGLLSHISASGNPAQAWSPRSTSAPSPGPPSSTRRGKQHVGLQLCPSDLLSSTEVESPHGERRPRSRRPVQGPPSSRSCPAQAAPAAARAGPLPRTPIKVPSAGPQAIQGTRAASTHPPVAYSEARAARCITRRRSSAKTLLLGGHPGHTLL